MKKRLLIFNTVQYLFRFLNVPFSWHGKSGKTRGSAARKTTYVSSLTEKAGQPRLHKEGRGQGSTSRDQWMMVRRGSSLRISPTRGQECGTPLPQLSLLPWEGRLAAWGCSRSRQLGRPCFAGGAGKHWQVLHGRCLLSRSPCKGPAVVAKFTTSPGYKRPFFTLVPGDKNLFMGLQSHLWKSRQVST